MSNLTTPQQRAIDHINESICGVSGLMDYLPPEHRLEAAVIRMSLKRALEDLLEDGPAIDRRRMQLTTTANGRGGIAPVMITKDKEDSCTL